MNDFKYGLSLLNTLYGIEMDEDDYEEMALIGWNLIGNKRTRLYRYCVNVGDCQDSVELPCNVEDIESVTLADLEEWAYSTNDTNNGDLSSFSIEQYTEHRKRFRHPLYNLGKFIKYERVGNYLFFDKPWGKVSILYKGILADENGLPEITDKEARALATYCAWITKYKEALQTNNTQIMQFANTLLQQWNLQCDLARVDHYMSQNEWDLVLDIKTCWSRKSYNKSHKLIQ